MALRATIIGAGPVGSLLALLFAQRGIASDVYERCPDPRIERVTTGCSVNLAICRRGFQALSAAGVGDAVLKHAVPMFARVFHNLAGRDRVSPYGGTKCVLSISRPWLNDLLIAEAEKTKLVDFHFGYECSGMDLDERRLHFKHQGAEVTIVPDGVVIGADGSASALRQDMSDAGILTYTRSELDYGYKELIVPPSADGSGKLEKHALHMWLRTNFFLNASPMPDGSLGCKLVLPLKGGVSFDALKNESDVEAFFSKHFQSFMPLIENLSEQFFQNPTGILKTIKCSNWSYKDNVLLIGDAAHAMTPFLAQGMNSSFEDLVALTQLIDERGEELEGIFQEFFESRKEDIDAMADMAVDSFLDLRDRSSDPKLPLRKSVEKLLEREFPEEFASAFTLVTFTTIPYAVAQRVGAAANDVVTELLSGIESIDDVDLDLARNVIYKRLGSLLTPCAERQSQERLSTVA